MIRTEQLTKRYGGTKAVDHLDVEIPAGSVVGVIGPNGAGKTTLLRLLLGLAPPTSGGGAVLGRDLVAESRASSTSPPRTDRADSARATSTVPSPPGRRRGPRPGTRERP